MFLLEGVELGKTVPDRKLPGVAGVDAADERVHGIIEKFAAEPTNHKVRDALLRVRGGAAPEGFAEEVELGSHREERRGEETSRRSGHGHRPAVADDVAL